MNKLLAIITLAIFAISCSPKLAFYEAKLYAGLKPKVESIDQHLYLLEDDKQTENLYQRTIQKFDNKGRLAFSSTCIIKPNEDNELVEVNYQYDNKSTTPQLIITTEKTDNIEMHVSKLELIEKTRKKNIYRHSYANRVDTVATYYNEKENTATTISKDRYLLDYERTVKYEKNLQTEKKYYTGQDNNLRYTEVYNYNRNGDVLRYDVMVDNEIHNMTIEMEYTKFDERNNWTERKLSYKNGEKVVEKRKLVYR